VLPAAEAEYIRPARVRAVRSCSASLVEHERDAIPHVPPQREVELRRKPFYFEHGIREFVGAGPVPAGEPM
jgi:hypothetical protein